MPLQPVSGTHSTVTAECAGNGASATLSFTYEDEKEEEGRREGREEARKKRAARMMTGGE